ncbi:MAG: tetratricopeptide repeat protein [Cyanobacteriota bacterium]|nr:tetratricopeptide repeat protein [Cyanobacteriota bacterium]
MTQQHNTNDGRDQYILNQPEQVTIDNSVTSIHPSPARATTIDESVPPLTAWQERLEEATIARWFTRPDISLVGIYGAGGFGKSALAAKVYGDARGFDRKLWANFGQPKPFGQFALWLISQAIGMERYAKERELYERDSDEELLMRALNLWAGKRVLLVMDNMETLQAESTSESTGNLYQKFWEAWLERNSRGVLLLTTQEKVQLPLAERREWLTLTGLDITNGVALLRAEPFRIAGEEADLQAFVEAADGHPLLLRLAASWLVARAKDDEETAEIYRLQRDDVTLLRQITAAHNGDTEATVEKVLDKSFDRLREEWRLLLVRASVLQGRVTVAAARAMVREVAVGKMRDASFGWLKKALQLLRGTVSEVTVDELRELARHSFWQEKRQGEEWEFEFLPLIRRYLGLQAQEMGQVEIAHTQAIEYFKTAIVPWDGTFASCEAEFELFHHLCELGQFGAADKVMDSCVELLNRAGYYRELVPLYERLTGEWEAQTPEEEKNLGWAWTQLGNLDWNLGQYVSAIDHHEQARDIFRTLDDKKGIAASLSSLGHAYDSLGQYQKAINFHQQSLDIKRQIGDRGGEANSLIGLGHAYDSLGQYQKAIDFYQQSLDIKRQIGERGGEEISLSSLGNVYNSLGEYQKAIDFHQQSLDIKRQIGNRTGEAASFIGLGNAYKSLGQYQRAIDFYQQSLEMKREIGDRSGEATSFIGLGNTYYSLGQYQKAIDFHQQSLDIARQIGERSGEGTCLNNLGNAYYSLGQYQKAIDFYQQSLDIKRQIGERGGEGTCLNNLGNAYKSLGQYQKAIDFHLQSLEIKREIGDRSGEALSLNNLGIASRNGRQYQKAIDFHLQSLDIARQIGDRSGEAVSLGNLGNVYQSFGQYQKAIDFYQQSLEIAREIEDRRGEARSLFNQADALAKIKNHPEALQCYQQAKQIYAELKLAHLVEKCDTNISKLARL